MDFLDTSRRQADYSRFETSAILTSNMLLNLRQIGTAKTSSQRIDTHLPQPHGLDNRTIAGSLNIHVRTAQGAFDGADNVSTDQKCTWALRRGSRRTKYAAAS